MDIFLTYPLHIQLIMFILTSVILYFVYELTTFLFTFLINREFRYRPRKHHKHRIILYNNY